jgi:thioredoxin reductase
VYHVAIIGGGPAGLSAALVLARAMRNVVIIDAGQPRNAAARELHGFLGHDPIAPQKLQDLGRAEVARYGVEIMDDRAIGAKMVDSEQPFPTEFHVWTSRGRSIHARKLLVATGIADRLPEVPGLRECYGVSVHHCPFCDGWEHRGRRLFALAESITDGIGLATALRSWSEHVTLLANGSTIAGGERVCLTGLGIAHCESAVRRLIHEQGQLQAIELDADDQLPADALFFQSEQQQPSDLLSMLHAACDKRQHAESSAKQKTKVPGVFVAGDADGDLQFAVVAAAEGATAAVSIHRELQDEDCHEDSLQPTR